MSTERNGHVPTKIKLSGPNSHIIRFMVRKPEVVVRKLNCWTEEEGILRIVCLRVSSHLEQTTKALTVNTMAASLYRTHNRRDFATALRCL